MASELDKQISAAEGGDEYKPHRPSSKWLIVLAILFTVALTLPSLLGGEEVVEAPTRGLPIPCDVVWLTPASVEIRYVADKPAPWVMTVYNGSEVSVPARVVTSPNTSSRYDYIDESWISFSETVFTLLPGEEKDIAATLVIPGSHFPRIYAFLVGVKLDKEPISIELLSKVKLTWKGDKN